MTITRHFIDVGSRRVHYRRYGRGPMLLLMHQSPRSSIEMEPLMRRWGAHFTCVAPDTPGFGQSDPLPGGAEIDIADLADAVLALLDALAQGPVLGYGIRSGAVILLAALRRRASAFRAIAVTGFGMHTVEEQSIFSDRYLPPFRPTPYGEHLAWLWQRSVEQSWFFPWYAAEPENRFPTLHTDVDTAASAVMQMLDSGDAYRAGYGAVLRSLRTMPPADAEYPPVLFSTFRGAPMEAHLDRIGEMPGNWRKARAETSEEDEASSLAMLREHAGPSVATLPEAADEGFVSVETDLFSGLVHWRGVPGGTLRVHGPGRSLELLEPADGVAIDLPGHGLSDRWRDSPPVAWPAWQAVIDESAARLGCSSVALEPAPAGDPARQFPDLTPDRFGCYLTKAWGIVRARHFFETWYEPSAATMRTFVSSELTPERLALEHRALLRASAAQHYAIALADRSDDEHGRGSAPMP